MQKRLVRANASWYIDIYDKLDYKDYPHTYEQGFSTADWVDENAAMIAKTLGMSEKEVVSADVIKKIDNGILVSQLYGSYSDFYKEAYGIRPRGDKLDESSLEAFVKDYEERMDKLEEVVKEEDARYEKAVEENESRVDDVLKTAQSPEEIAQFKDENRFELSDKALKKLRDGINEKVHEKLMDNIDFYSVDELQRFKDGYRGHITKEDNELLNKTIKQRQKEEEYESMY